MGIEWFIIGFIILGIIALIIYEVIPKKSIVQKEQIEDYTSHKKHKHINSKVWSLIGNILQICVPSVTFFIVTANFIVSFGFMFLYSLFVFREFFSKRGKTLKSLLFWCSIFFSGHVFVYCATNLNFWDNRIKTICIFGIIGVIINMFFSHISESAFYSHELSDNIK